MSYRRGMPARGPKPDPVLSEYALARLDDLLPSSGVPAPGQESADSEASRRQRVVEQVREASTQRRDPLDVPVDDGSDHEMPVGRVRRFIVEAQGRAAAWTRQAPRFLKAHLAVVVGVVVVGAVVTGYMLVQTRTSSVAVRLTPSASMAESPSPSVPSSSASTSPAATAIYVHLVGAVVRPGVVCLATGARVADAITAAGGLRPDADPGELNLAMVVPDGSQVVIGTKKSPRGELNPGTSGGGAATSAPGTSTARQSLDLNAATQSQLESLPGVGPVTASKILEWRESHGTFSRIEELQEVSGIGEKTFAQIAPHVHV